MFLAVHLAALTAPVYWLLKQHAPPSLHLRRMCGVTVTLPGAQACRAQRWASCLPDNTSQTLW